MNRALDFLAGHWFATVLVVIAAACAVVVAINRRRQASLLLPLLLAAAGFGALAAGDLVVPSDWAAWLAVGAAVALFLMLMTVILTGKWWAPLGYTVAALLLVGLGALSLTTVGHELSDWYTLLRSLEASQLWWFGLLGLVPIIVVLSFRSLAGLGPVRRWVAIGLRCLVVILLTLALTELRASHHGDTTTVLFLIDCSLSIPEDVHAVNQQFVNTMAELRRSTDNYQVGVIYFGAQPRLVRSATDAPRINVNYHDAIGSIDRNYTSIAAALKLALASFPEGTSKRIVLITDGNENLGNAEEQARLAKLNGVQIDVVPIGAGQRRENEVLIQSIDAPPEVEEGAPLLIQVALRSFNPNTVAGMLTVQQRLQREGVDDWVDVAPPKRVQLGPGLKTITFERPRLPEQKEKQGSFTFRAKFVPLWSKTSDGKTVEGLPGDRPENNTATTHVIARRDKSRILLLEPTKDAFKLLEDNLPTAANPLTRDNPKYDFDRRAVRTLPPEDDLGPFLSGYDCVILANLPASSITEAQQKIIRSNTHDQGCGLIMIGGPDSFGAGAWQGTPVEEALPVDTDIKSFKIQGKVGLVMLMHASEMPKGNYWQKEIAKMAIKELTAVDEVGILYYDWGTTKWHIKLQQIGDNKEGLRRQVDKLSPGDMPDFGPGLRMAYDALTEEKRELMGKHVIVISDGDPQQTDATVLAQMKAAKITVTTVGVATHGAPQDQSLSDIAAATNGRFYNVKNPSALPSIYLKETRLISQDFLYQKPFTPELRWRSGPAESLKSPLPQLTGFVRTMQKSGEKSEAVTTAIESPEIAGRRFPILAYWHYGLGKSVAFTSDAEAPRGKVFWAKRWFDDGIYGKFWEQVIDWSLRPVESKKLTMTMETRDGITRVTVVARDKDKPINNLILRGGVTGPSTHGEDRRKLLNFKQKNAGVYEAEFKAEESGSYIINAEAVRTVKRTIKDENGNEKVQEVEEGFDSVRGGVTIPYSPEFAEVESNPALLDRLRDLTGGMTFPEERLKSLYEKALAANKVPREARDERPPAIPTAAEVRSHDEEASALVSDVYRAGLPSSKSRQPIWFWLLFLAGVLLFFDVAVRRITIDPAKVASTASATWQRLRGRAVAMVQSPEFFDRLKSRKAQVGETLVKVKAERRFEAGDEPVAPPPGGADMPPPAAPPPRPTATPSVTPEKEEGEAADFGSRLLKAKRRVWKEREKEK